MVLTQAGRARPGRAEGKTRHAMGRSIGIHVLAVKFGCGFRSIYVVTRWRTNKVPFFLVHVHPSRDSHMNMTVAKNSSVWPVA
jgi:hypothetical protein